MNQKINQHYHPLPTEIHANILHNPDCLHSLPFNPPLNNTKTQQITHHRATISSLRRAVGDLNQTINQHGRVYSNGRPLPTEIRANIILLHKLAVRPCEISRRLKISHGVVSKIIKQ
jgi:hypothetical protein